MILATLALVMSVIATTLVAVLVLAFAHLAARGLAVQLVPATPIPGQGRGLSGLPRLWDTEDPSRAPEAA